MKKLVIASNNPGKLREIGAILAPLAIEVVPQGALGVPEASDFGFEKVFALDAGLEELRGVSFTKGCYIGQELTSRMKHRATTRKRILTITAQMDLPGTGAVTRGGSEIGEILSSHGQTAFALVRLDRLEETQGDITAASIPVTLTRPSWLS